jgi:hypothetical protein
MEFAFELFGRGSAGFIATAHDASQVVKCDRVSGECVDLLLVDEL